MSIKEIQKSENPVKVTFFVKIDKYRKLITGNFLIRPSDFSDFVLKTAINSTTLSYEHGQVVKIHE